MKTTKKSFGFHGSYLTYYQIIKLIYTLIHINCFFILFDKRIKENFAPYNNLLYILEKEIKRS